MIDNKNGNEGIFSKRANRSTLEGNSSRLSPVSLELLYPFAVHVNIFVMRRYAIHELLKKKERREAEKNVQKFSVEIYSVSVHVISTSAQVLSMRT